MRRFALLILLFSLALSLAKEGSTPLARAEGLSVPLAAPAGTWASGIKIQNLTGSTGIVVVDFYDSSGNIAWSESGSLPASGSVEYYLPALSSGFSSGKYSAVVSSDVSIAAVATQTNYDSGIADSYNGSVGTAAEVGVPYIFRGLNNWYTVIYAQNLGTSTKTVQLLVGGQIYPQSVAAKATATFALEESTYSALGSGFRGSGIVKVSDSSANVAVSTFTARLSPYHVLHSMAGAESANTGTSVALPSLYKTFNGWNSGIQLLNPSNSATITASVRFKSDTGAGSFDQTRSNIVLGPQQSTELYLPAMSSPTIPDGFKGSATVTSSGGSVQASVITTNYSRDVALGYTGLAQTAVTRRLSLPSLYKFFGVGDWNTGIKVVNVGSGPTGTLTFTFYADSGSPSCSTCTRTVSSLAVGESFEFYLPGTPLDGGGFLPNGFKGSATVVAADSSAKIAGTGLHTNYGRGVANIYNAIPY